MDDGGELNKVSFTYMSVYICLCVNIYLSLQIPDGEKNENSQNLL